VKALSARCLGYADSVGSNGEATEYMDNDLKASPGVAARLAREVSALALLIEQMTQGRQDALARLYDETSSLLNGLLLRMLDQPQDAEEVLLDVYMKAWKYAPSYSPDRGSVQTWLVTMARNTAIDRIRQKRAQPKTLSFEPEDTPEPESTDASPEERTAMWERRRKVQALLNELPAEQRQALVMAYFGGFSHAELAARLGQPLGTVKSRIRMGLLRLRSLLEEPTAI
jgi:RNA polymerase sigma-70 factor (ECF subfamily)